MKGINEKELIEAAEKLQRACRDDHLCKVCPFGGGGECKKRGAITRRTRGSCPAQK